MVRAISPTHITNDVEPIINSQSFQVNGTVRNTSPPQVTIMNCPTRISNSTANNA